MEKTRLRARAETWKNSQATAQKERGEVNFPAGSGTGACHFPIGCNRQFQQRQESQADH
ncbi:hypothetical protein [Geobacter sp. DSM 9736]|uniref:hypothetical protein n=1 Tax=Geobacter sp. DSM 9736 TaxID=1277350 RepID=UPI0012FDD1BC|nr:hypothetical protein [Geobacter sp. DSM 9736]